MMSIKHGAFAALACLILAWAPPAEAQGEELTYYKSALPIFQRHCMHCHHKGGTAPQSLETYKLSRPWIRTSRKMLEDEDMPPWQADPEIGQWRNYDSVAADEIEMIAKWVDDFKGQEGDEANNPPALDYSNPWMIGTPDKILTAEETVEIPAEGDDVYHSYVLDPGFTEDTWLSGAEMRPDEADVIMRMWLSAAPADVVDAADAAVEGPGFAAFDRGWGEGAKDHIAVLNKGMTLYEKFPEGSGVLIPAGWKLVLHAQYGPVGDPLEDQPKVGLYVASSAPAKEFKTLSVENRELDIPEESYDLDMHADLTLDKAITVHTILPRMNYLGRELILSATRPGEGAETLLHITDFNLRMHARYAPAEPIKLPAGTKLEIEAIYENSFDNPNIPTMSISDAAYGAAPGGELLSVVLGYIED